MINLRRVKILGAYLTVACALQICLYLAMSISAERYERFFPFAIKQIDLFYFNPRLGFSAFENGATGPGIFGWVSAAWVLALGLLLLSGRPEIRAYVISEIALSAPNLLFVVIVVCANLGRPVHGAPPVRELFVPVCVMIIFSVVPLILAFRARSKRSTRRAVSG